MCVQNNYNLAHRHDDALIDDLTRQEHRIRAILSARRVYSPLQSPILSSVAGRVGATPMRVALALAATPRPKRPADSRYFVDPPSTRESRGSCHCQLAPEMIAELYTIGV